MCYVKFKETNQICSPLKINQSINAESSCDRNNKSMYSCFYKSKKFLSCLIKKEEKTENSENVFFLKFLLKIFVNMEKLFMTDRLPNGHGKAMICSICYITKSRLDVQFVTKIPLEMFNRLKKGVWSKLIIVFILNFPFICYLSRMCN